MKVALDLHDFSVVNNRMLWLLKLKEHFPNFKVTLFTIPIDEKRDWGPYLIRNEYLKVIKENLDWIQLVPHGLKHIGSEVRKWDYDYMKKVLLIIEEIFKQDGLPFEKGFCAPHWRWNSGVVRALDEAGWWGAVYKEESKPYTKKFYRPDYCLNDQWPLNMDLKLHGHIFGTRNDLGLCFDNLMRLPVDTDWHFVTDFLEEK